MSKLPEITCRRCGSLKLPRQKCPTCFPPGAPQLYTQLEGTKEIVARIREERKERERKRHIESIKHADRQRQNSKAARAFVRLTVMIEAMQMLLNCFERDRTGDWTIYEDKLEQMQKAVKAARIALEACTPSVRDLQLSKVWHREGQEAWQEICQGTTLSTLKTTLLRKNKGT